mmetsp:Transcript_63979/g.187701  ORF Transcript_63979/g.187701 Transcript_63979/m.187701 type:complete len:328 (+) Transcript_63979:1842-2825(+)
MQECDGVQDPRHELLQVQLLEDDQRILGELQRLLRLVVLTVRQGQHVERVPLPPLVPRLREELDGLLGDLGGLGVLVPPRHRTRHDQRRVRLHLHVLEEAEELPRLRRILQGLLDLGPGLPAVQRELREGEQHGRLAPLLLLVSEACQLLLRELGGLRQGLLRHTLPGHLGRPSRVLGLLPGGVDDQAQTVHLGGRVGEPPVERERLAGRLLRVPVVLVVAEVPLGNGEEHRRLALLCGHGGVVGEAVVAVLQVVREGQCGALAAAALHPPGLPIGREVQLPITCASTPPLRPQRVDPRVLEVLQQLARGLLVTLEALHKRFHGGHG